MLAKGETLMPPGTFSDEAIKAVQEAQNTLTAFYDALMESLNVIDLVVPLYFFYWEPFYSESPLVNFNRWNSPIYSPEFSALTHLPLICSKHHFSTLDHMDNQLTKPAKSGDAFVTFMFSPNKAIREVDREDNMAWDWPITLPIEGPLAQVVAYKMTKDDDLSMFITWEQLKSPEPIGPVGEIYPMENPKIVAWARSFDLVKFLNNPSDVYNDLGTFLKEGR
jgi:hypothetical protein